MKYFNLLALFKKQPVKPVILCRPRGGLNDMLCQIEKCWRYAERHKRHLVVDTLRSGFLDNFSRYFLPKDNNFVTFGDFDETLWKGSVLPKALQGRINSYTVRYSEKFENFIDSHSKKRLTVNLDRPVKKPHREPILVHEQCGGGAIGIHALARLTLTPSVAETIVKKLDNLGEYSAVHVRNTDYQTDYRSLFQHVMEDAAYRKIVLCTDDWHCQQYAREVFGDRIYMSSEIPRTDGRPLHDNPVLDRYQTNLDAITDLLVLASAKQLFVCNHMKGKLSGYSMLAKMLNEQRDIIDGLVGREAQP